MAEGRDLEGRPRLHPLRVPKPLHKTFQKKEPDRRAALTACFVQLRKDPYHPSLRTKKMGGTKDIFEARVDGKNRVTFKWDGDTIVIQNHCKHDVVSK